MINSKVIDKENLFKNLSLFSNKKVCAMVKANAYGHGIKEIVNLLHDKVFCFGVANVEEAILVRSLCDLPVWIVGKTTEFEQCKKFDLCVMIENLQDLRSAVEVGLEKNLNLEFDCGMNRFGLKSNDEIRKIDEFLTDNNINLNSVCAHFSNTSNRFETQKQYEKFENMKQFLSQTPQVSFGGSGLLNFGFDFDILRVGIGLYGYGSEYVKPILSIVSKVCSVFFAKKGEKVGYDGAYVVEKDSYFAIVPLGYADGIKRELSNQFYVKIKGKQYCSIGKICMDCFFVLVDENVFVGDEVEVCESVAGWAEKCKTIPYEILTGFSNLRGKTLIE